MNKFLLLMAAAVFSCAATARQAPYVINLFNFWQDQQIQQHFSEAIRAIYRPLGIEVEVVFLPRKRAFKMIEQGLLDAEGFRIDRAFDHSVQVLQVPVPFKLSTAHVYCLKEDKCQVDGVKSHAYSGETLLLEDFCKHNQLSCIAMKHNEFALQMVQEGLVDSWLEFDLNTRLASCKFKGKRLYRKQIPELKLEYYHYIHVKHKALLPKLTAVLEQFSKRGALKKVMDQAAEMYACELDIVELK